MMQIAHVGQMKPVMSFADMQATIRDSIAPWNLAISGDRLHSVSLRVSQVALGDPHFTARNLKAILGEYDLDLVGFSAVSLMGGTKEQVHHPDWRSEERLSAMFAAANLAVELATTDEFSITTSALSHRRWVDASMPGNWAALTLNVMRVVQHLVTIREKTGLTIHLDLEAEPGSLLRNTDDIVRFWEQWLVVRGAAMLSDRMSITDGTAAETVLRHVRLALDTAHAAVVWDDPATSLQRFLDAGVKIGRLQVSAALECDIPLDDRERAVLTEVLRALVSPTLSQQVVSKTGEQFEDLPDAIAAIDTAIGQTWRIHTHAPVLADRYDLLRSTRPVTASWLREIAARGVETGLVELRSANWAVVEDAGAIPDMITREAEWVEAQHT
ncbi:MAG: hypothetical protein KC435_04870 [Thermomicrobiales bacterium]|nr:hypothetical protein [Thermomicrobiales bacterium]